MIQKQKQTTVTAAAMAVFILMNFVLGMSSSLFNGILDQVAAELQFTISQSGSLNSFYLYGAGIGVPVFLILFRRQDRILLLKAMLAFHILATAVLLLVRGYIPMLAVRFLMGLSGNCYSVLATATIAALTPKERLGKALSVLIAGSAAANIIGVPMVRALSGILTWQHIFMILIVIMLVCLVYMLTVFRLHITSEKPLQLKDELAFFRKRGVIVALSVSLITFLGYGLQTYLTPYVITLFPAAEPYMSLILVLIGIFAFIGNHIGGLLCDRFGYRKAMIFGSAAQAVTSLLLLFTQHMMYVNLILILIWMMNAWLLGLEINTSINVETEGKSGFLVSMNSSGIQLGTAIGAGIAASLINTAGISWVVITPVIASLAVIVILVTAGK